MINGFIRRCGPNPFTAAYAPHNDLCNVYIKSILFILSKKIEIKKGGSKDANRY